ncbi:MAG TPA: NPCBM/NEW2 domain-containing protein [Gemmataceae bacterium]
MPTRCRSYLLAASLVLTSAGPVAADGEAKEPVFAVRTAAGTTLEGTWRELKRDWSVRVGEGEGTPVSGNNVLAVRRKDAPLPPLPVYDHLLLANGDRLPFKGLRLVGEKFQFRHPSLEAGKAASVPLAAVSVLWLIAPDKTLDAEKLRRRLAADTRDRDTLCLRNGDVLAGVLTGLDENNVEMEVEKKQVKAPIGQVAYIAFNTELADALRPKGVYARLVMTEGQRDGGGRLSLTSASCSDGETLTGTTVFGARVRVPLREVAALDLYQGQAVHLSDLKPAKYDYRPFLDATWPYALNANVAGHDLRLGGSTYDKGVSLHSHSRLSYRAGGAYRRFEALVGLDERDGREGSVRVRVLADGEALVDRELTRRDGAVPIAVKIEGVRELTLEVDFGAGADVQDVVNWVDARLIRR